MQFKGTFYCCDFDEERRAIRIFLRGNEKTIVGIQSYSPYFFAIPKGIRLARLEEEMKNLRIRSKGREIKALRVERIKAKVDWKEKEVLKIYVELPDDRRELEKRIEGIAECREVKVEPWRSFILDNLLIPLNEVRIEGRVIEEGKNYLLVEFERIEDIGGKVEDLKAFYFTTIISSEHGFPIAGKDPILVISCLARDKPRIFEAKGSDKKLIMEFLDFFKDYDPEIVIGYEQDSDEFPYIFARARKYGIPLTMGKLGEEPIETGKYFRGMILKETLILGRINADFFPTTYRDFPWLPTRSLNELAQELGLKPIEEIPPYKIKELWRRDRKRVLKYAKERVLLIKSIAEKLLPFQLELCKLAKLMPQQVFRFTIGELNDSLVLAEGKRERLILPEKGAEQVRYFIGGEVWLKQPGLYEKVGYIDFRSMYPSIISKFNISPETVDCPCCKGKGRRFEIREAKGKIGHWVCNQKEGFLSKIVRELMKRREEIKGRMRKLRKGSPIYKQLYAKQHVLKICANAMYGYLGWAGSRLYKRESAELITALGRDFIRKLRKFLESRGYEVIYLDTDGIQIANVTLKECEELVKEINQEFPIVIEVQHLARRAIYWTKKKYCHWVDGRLIAKGMEFIRRDYPRIIKDCQEEVIKEMLRSKRIERAEKVALRWRGKIESKLVSKEELVLVEQLAKKIEMYERTSKIKAAAEWLRKKGIELHRGMNLKLVIVKGEEPINYRARPVEFFELEDCDLDYYLKLFDQVIQRTLEVLR